MPKFQVSIKDAAGTPLGPGPVDQANRITVRTRLDRAGDLAFQLPATDPRGAILQHKRIMEPQTLIGTQWQALTSGVIEKLETDPRGLTLNVSGPDILIELTSRTLPATPLNDGSGGPKDLTASLDAIMAKAPAGWTIDYTTYRSTGNTHSTTTIDNVTNVTNWAIGTAIIGSGIPAGAVVTNIVGATLTISAAATSTATGVLLVDKQVYADFNGEKVLAALGKVAEDTGHHFRNSGRQVVWLYRTQPASGLRAEKETNGTSAGVCLITDIRYVRDSSSLVTRVTPYGSGNSTARLTLKGTTRTPPTGYSLDLTDPNVPVLVNTTAETAYGRWEDEHTFSEIGQQSKTPPHGVSAANMLYDAAYEYLQRLSQVQESYQLTIAAVRQIVVPGTTIMLVYNGYVPGYKWIDINKPVVVLEAELQIDSDGIQTVGLTVATVDRWPTDDRPAFVSGGDVQQMIRSAAQQKMLLSHVQKAATSLQADSADTAAGVTGFTPTAGKTLTVNNSLTLAGTDGKSLTLTGSLTVGADTTISGGGTLALGGFAGTLPATGTLALRDAANTFAAAQVVNETDTGTTNATSTLQIAHLTSGTPAANFGINFVMRAHTSNRTNSVQAQITSSWVVSTNGSQTARLRLLANDSGGGREGLRVEASGSAPLISFYGGTARAQAAAYTLTGTATRVFPTDPSVAYTGINNAQAGTVYAQLADLNTLRTAVSTLIGVVRQLETDLGATSGVGLIA